MNSVRFNKMKPVNNFFEDLFEDLFTEGKEIHNTLKRTFSQPMVNIVEEKDAFHIEMAIPGVNKENVQIEVEKDQLLIKAKTSDNDDVEAKKYTRKEFFYGDFEKSFYLPETVQKDAIDASFSNGVLYIELKKKEEAVDKGPQHIEIK